MRKLIYLGIILGIISLVSPAKAQVRVSVNLNLQPDWGPSGYEYVEYYYIPEIDVYFDVVNKRYVYWENNAWVHRSKLPSRYRNVDLNKTYKVVMNTKNPWNNHASDKAKYSKHAKDRNQVSIKDNKKNAKKNKKK